MSHKAFTHAGYRGCPVIPGWSDGSMCLRNLAVDDKGHRAPPHTTGIHCPAMNTPTNSRARILAALAPVSPLRLPLPMSPRPALDADATKAAFTDRARAAAAEVVALPRMEAIPAWVRQRLPETTPTVAPGLRDLDWRAFVADISFGRAQAATPCAVSLARCGIAEIGALVLASGADTPTTLNFLPDLEIVVLEARHIVPHLEDAWALLRPSAAFPPRALNLIVGPSRTADIEQTIQLGAHGPRSLVILLIG